MKYILAIVQCIVGLFIIVIVYSKVEKWKEKREKKLAVEKAKAAIAEIACHCSADSKKMISAVEYASEICSKGLMDESLSYSSSQDFGEDAKSFMIAFDSCDYILFAHLSALHYAKQYVEDDPERIAIEEYCVPYIHKLETRHRTGEYKECN